MGIGVLSTRKSRVRDGGGIKAATCLDSDVGSVRQANDMNLPAVISDPLLWNIFREWLGGVFADKYLMCWTDIDIFETLAKTSLDKKKIRARAVYLYKKHVDSEGYTAVGLDQSERENIRLELGIGTKNSSYSTKNKRFNTPSSVFHDAKLKIFHKLRYDYFPHFLGSYNPDELTEKIRRQAADEVEQKVDLVQGSNFMSSSFVLKYFREYLYSCPIIDNIMLPSDYLDCLLEIRDFNLSNQKEHRVDRLQLILHRYTALNLPMLGLISNKFDAKPGKYSDPKTSIFDDVYNDIVSKLANEYLSPFQSSIHGHRLLIEWDELDTSMENTGNFQSPVHKVKNLAKKNRDIQAELNMIKRIGMDTAMPSSISARFVGNGEMKRSCNSFSVYNSSSLNGDITLQMLLSEPLGLSMFRKFNYDNYQEENINFWITVTAFHRDDLVAPQGCSHILNIREDMTFEQLRLGRAQLICEEFINEGSPKEVNISKSMREAIQRRIDMNGISKDLFDDAHLEVVKLMKFNLWSRFTKTAMFAFFSEKYRQKEAREMDPRRIPEIAAASNKEEVPPIRGETKTGRSKSKPIHQNGNDDNNSYDADIKLIEGGSDSSETPRCGVSEEETCHISST